MEARYRCPQCKERFRDSGDRIPKLLPACLHTVCLACLSASYEKDQTLRCPIASCALENSTKLPEEGFLLLRELDDEAMMKLMNFLSIRFRFD